MSLLRLVLGVTLALSSPPRRPLSPNAKRIMHDLVPLQPSHKQLLDLSNLDKVVRKNADFMLGNDLLQVLINLKDNRQWELALALAKTVEAHYSPSNAMSGIPGETFESSDLDDESSIGTSFQLRAAAAPSAPLQTIHYNVLLACLAPAQRWREAIDLMERMRKREIARETITYNSLLKVLEYSGRWKLAMKFLRRMRKENVDPDTITFTSAISACAKSGEWRTALLLLRMMDEAGIEPNTITYTAAIAACERACEWRRALQLLIEMQDRDVKADLQTFNTAVGACGRAGEWERAFSIVQDEMASIHIEPNVITYNCLINACANGKPPLADRALELLEEMKERGLEPDIISYNSVLAALARAGDAARAVSMLKAMRSSASENGVSPDSISMTTAISACAEAGAWEEAIELLSELRSSGMKVPTLAYSKAIAALKKCGRWQQACGLLRTISSERLAHNAVTTNFVLEACDAAGESAVALRELLELFEYVERSRQPYPADGETISQLLRMVEAVEAGERMLGTDPADATLLSAIRMRIPRIQAQLQRIEIKRAQAASEAAEVESALQELEKVNFHESR